MKRLVAALAAAATLPAWAALPTVASPATAPSSAPGFAQAAFGLLLVLALIFGCAWAARRFGAQRWGATRLVNVVSSAPVGPRERVVVVEVAGTWLVLGVTSRQVTALHHLPAQAQPAATAAPDAAADLVARFSLALREAIGGKRGAP